MSTGVGALRRAISSGDPNLVASSMMPIRSLPTGEIVFHRRWLIQLPDGNAIIDLGFRHFASGVMLAYLAAVVALAALTWRMIERPGQRLFNRLAAAENP